MGNERYITKDYSDLRISPSIFTVRFRTSSILRWENKHILNFSETTSEKAAMSNSEK